MKHFEFIISTLSLFWALYLRLYLQMPRQVINQPVYIVNRAPLSQPNLLPVRSLPNHPLNHQANGVAGAQVSARNILFLAMLSHIYSL